MKSFIGQCLQGMEMVFSVAKHLLYKGDKAVVFDRTPNGGKPLNPLYLILHYTAGVSGESAITWFKNPQAQASAQLVIDRAGEVTQMMEFNKVCWHAGKSTWGDIDGLNQYSIGIEIANAGKLLKTASGRWISWSGAEIPLDEVIVATHKDETTEAGWQRYTQEQIDAVIEIGLALNAAYKFRDVLGHEDISRFRKVDPGPAFPMRSVQSKIMGRPE